MRENRYQPRVIARLEDTFPGCFIHKNDPSYRQGVPDLSVFYGRLWAMLEVKASIASPVQPNQNYYVDLLNNMGFASFIYPENEEEVFGELQQFFSSARLPRTS